MQPIFDFFFGQYYGYPTLFIYLEIIAVIFGFLGKKKATETGVGSGQAITGIINSYLARLNIVMIVRNPMDTKPPITVPITRLIPIVRVALLDSFIVRIHAIAA